MCKRKTTNISCLDSLIYDPERLSCSDQEKDACLETVGKLARLRRKIRQNGVLTVLTLAETEKDPFSQTCLLEAAEGYEPAVMERLFAAYLAAGDYRGGVFLNAVLIAKGLLLLCEQVNNEPDMGDAAWGQLLSVELRGFFGVEYRERVPAAIERKTSGHIRRKVSLVPAFDHLAQLSVVQRRQLLQNVDVRTLAIALQGASAAADLYHQRH